MLIETDFSNNCHAYISLFKLNKSITSCEVAPGSDKCKIATC